LVPLVSYEEIEVRRKDKNPRLDGRREGGKEGRREGGKEGRREGGKEGRREGGKDKRREE
jgi:hypothetical protein